MTQNDALLNLIKAFKKNDQQTADKILQHMVGNAEKRKQYKFAKKLREVYSKSSEDRMPAFFQSSSVAPQSLSDKGLFEIRKSNINSSKIVLSTTNRNILHEIIEGYSKRELLKQHGLANDSRLILHGPPGTGKTLFAYVIAVSYTHLTLPTIYSV